MLRQASSRNQRSKGFKIKHALQIALLIAICIWLLYQVKHSHDKKRALIERSSNILRTNADKKEDFFKFGRKDLPQTEVSQTRKDVENDETQEEEIEVSQTRKDVENDETQEEEIEEDQDTKQEEIIHEIEDKEAKDDDFDEQDQDKGDEEEHEHLFESTEEDEKYDKVKSNNEDENKEHDDVDVLDNQDREGSTQEAREENYKRDDASSAVAHDDQATESETGALVGRIIDEENVNASKRFNDTIIDGTNTESLDKKVLKSESVTNGTVEGTKPDVTLEINVTSAKPDGTKLDGIHENFEEKTESSTNVTSEKPDGFEENFEEKIEANMTSEINVDLVSKLDDSVNKLSANETVQINDSYHNGTVSENDNDKGTISNSTIVEYENARQTNTTNEIEVQINSTTNATMLNDISIDSTQIQGISNDIRTSGEDRVSLQNTTDVSANNTTAGDNQILAQNIVENSANNSTIAVDEQKSNSMMDSNANKNATTPYVNEIRNATQDNSDNSTMDEITEEKEAQIDLSTLPGIQTEVAMTSDDEAAV